MAQSFSLSSTVQVLSCPHCKETINTSMQQCPFCHQPIDSASAQVAAEQMSIISQACSDASYLKIMAGMLIPFFLCNFVPFITLLGIVGLRFLEVAIPVMSVRWWVKFGSIKTDDPDLSRARGTAILVTFVAAICLLLLLLNIIGYIAKPAR